MLKFRRLVLIYAIMLILTACAPQETAELPETPQIVETPPVPQVSINDLIEDALSLYETGQYAEAILLYTDVIKLEPLNFDANLGLGRAYFQLGDTEKAIEALQAAHEMNTDSEEALKELHNACDKAYQTRLNEMLSSHDNNAERKQLFESWLMEKYPAYADRKTIPLDEDVIKVLEDIEGITRWMEYYDLTSLEDEELFKAAQNFYLNPYRETGWYDFKYREYDDSYDAVSIVERDTMRALLMSLFSRDLQDIENSPSEGDPYVDGAYRMGVGDSGEMSFVLSECYYLDDDTWYVVFDGYNPAEEKTIDDVTGIVVRREEDSAFGFNIIARRGYYWGW